MPEFPHDLPHLYLCTYGAAVQPSLVLGRIEAHGRMAPSSAWLYSISNSRIRLERSVRGRCFWRRWLAALVLRYRFRGGLLVIAAS